MKVHGRRADEGRNELVVRLCVEFERRADLRDDAAIEHDDPIGERHGFDLVVRHIDHRGAEGLVKLGQFDAHLDAKHGVEIGQRFVEEKHFRLADERPSDGDALALPAGQLRRLAVHEFAQPEQASDLVCAFCLHSLRRPSDRQRECDVVADSQMRIERVGLEHHGDPALGRPHSGDVDTVDEDCAGGHLLEPGDHPQQCGLAAA